jgi:flagellar basal-body rod protein FlgB
MPIPQIPIFSMLRTRMQWNQERQQLLAENISNANTSKFKPRDLAPPTPNSPPIRPCAES